MEVSRTRLLRSVWLAVFGLGSLGCDSISARSSAAATNSDLDRCDGEPEISDIAWDDASELGTPADVFAGIEGQCDGALRWRSDADAKADNNRDSAATMHVEVQLDHARARFVQHTERGASARRSDCPSELEVAAHVTLRSDDGAIDASEQTKVRYRPDTVITFGFTLMRDEHRGSLMLQARKGETTTLSFELDGAGPNCAGEIMVSTSSTSASGTGRGAAGRVGSWSASGCPVGQAPFDVEQRVRAMPNEQSVNEQASGDGNLPALIRDTWNDRDFEGTWQDGAQATLHLQVTPLTAASCVEQRARVRTVTQPVEVRYRTDDGRLAERKTMANVRAGLTPDNTLSELSLWISDEMSCSTTNSQLDYTPTDCTQMKAATVQLGLNSSGDAASEPTDGGLNVYFIPRFADAEPDRDTLTLH